GALRVHHVDGVAGGQGLIGPGGEHPTEVFLDGHVHLAGGGIGADGVGAANLFAVDGGAQGHVLSGHVVVVLGQVGGHVEDDLHRIGGQLADVLDGERVERGAAAG